MKKEYPKVSIGLPVYNGENFISEAIESVLAQTMTDFEIIITDNASTDNTQRICEEYAARDSRIKYFRNEQNLGAAPNFNYAFELSKGEYFKWLAHDDIIAPTFLQKCSEVLDTDPSVVLVFPRTNVINSAGSVIKEYDFEVKTNSDVPHVRFADLVLVGHLCYEIFGLIRWSALQKTHLMGAYGHGDGVLLARLSLEGRFYQVPEALLLVRDHNEQSMAVYDEGNDYGRPDYHAYSVWFDSSKANKIILPNWTIFSEFNKAILQSSVSLGEKLRSFYQMLRWTKRHWHFMFKDLVVAARQIVGQTS